MEFEQSETTFALLDLPTVPLLHTLSFLPHSSLLPLAASCKFLHATVHNSSNLWRRLTLLPSMLILPTTTQSFIRVLRRHGSSVRAVKVKYTEERGMLENLQQLLAFLAASCPSLVHISLPYLTAFNLPPGVSGNDFWDFGNGNGNSSTHSQILGTGMGMKNSIPNFWEWERE